MLVRRTRIQLVAFAVISIVAIVYALIRFAGLGTVFGNSGYTVKLELNESGGIFTNAEVTYRGFNIGRVGELRLTKTGLEADLNIDPSAPQVPGGPRRRRRQPVRGRRAVRRPAAEGRQGPVPGGRLGHPGDQDDHPGQHRPADRRPRLARRVGPGRLAAHGRRRVLRRVPRHRRRPAEAAGHRAQLHHDRAGVPAADDPAARRRRPGAGHAERPGGELRLVQQEPQRAHRHAEELRRRPAEADRDHAAGGVADQPGAARSPGRAWAR